jgi:peptidoglycan/xylan/chitin deacetylase (PgdA/CDA1 family)
LKKAYLTIDDAPSRDFAPKMEFLHRGGVPALFFCEGRFIRGREDDLCRAVERGFLLGNHAFSHTRFSDLPLEEGKREIRQTDALIESIYRRAGIPRPAKYFRFPFFDGGGESGAACEADGRSPVSEASRYPREDKRRELQRYLRELGYRQPHFEGINLRYAGDPDLLAGADVRCTFDQCEYYLHRADAPLGLSEEAAILNRIEEDRPFEGLSLNREDTVDIVLLHDHPQTTELFYRIVERYLRKDIRFLAIPVS